MALSSSGSSKRACALVNNAVQTAICLVDGCAADLSNTRKYYQRHKVCEVHSKSPQVSINGQKLRFCQQCSRFHSLDEFDEGKRSCRKRLDGHNRRRRKPRPYIFSPHHGTNMLQSAGPPVHPTMALLSPLWSGGVAVAAPPWVDHTNYAPSLLSSLVSPPQSSCTPLTHEMQPQSASGSGSGSITTGPIDQGLSYGGLDDCDMGWGGMTDIDPRDCASLDRQDPQTHPFYWQ